MPTGKKAMKQSGEGRRLGNMELLLFQAAKHGSTKELEFVLELPEIKGSIDYQDQHNHSPLMVAARNGHLGCVRLLLGHGASLKLTTHRGGQEVNALQLAKKAGRTEVVQYLQKCVADQMKIGTTRASLEIDVERAASTPKCSPEQFERFSARLNLLLSYCDYDLNSCSEDTIPLLIRATKAGNVEIFLKLINEFKATPLINEMDTGYNILHLSCLNHSDLRYYIAKHFPSLLRNPDSTGAVPLHLACANNDHEFVSWLFGRILAEDSGMDQFCACSKPLVIKRSNSLPDIPKGRPIKRSGSRKAQKLGSGIEMISPVNLLSPMASLPMIRPTHRRVKSGGTLDMILDQDSDGSDVRKAGLVFSFDSTSTRSYTVSLSSSSHSRQNSSLENSTESHGLSESSGQRLSREPSLQRDMCDSLSPMREIDSREDTTPLPPPSEVTMATNGHHNNNDLLGLKAILANPPLSVREVVEMKPFRVDTSGNTVLHTLACKGHAPLLCTMLKVADYIKRSVDFSLLIHRDNARLPLEEAIQSQSTECIRLLLNFTLLAGLMEELQLDTLIVKMAVFTGNIDVVKVLLGFGFTAGLGPAIALAMVNEYQVILRLLLFYHTQVVNSLEFSHIMRHRQVTLTKGGINWDGLQLDHIDPVWLYDSYDAVDSVSRTFDLETILVTPEGNTEFYKQLGQDCLHYFNERVSSPTCSLSRPQLTMITEVNVGSNLLTRVPPELFQMPSLTVLIMSHNQLTSLPVPDNPHHILYTSALQRLELDWNQLETLPEALFRGVATSLEELSVECNRLKALPPGLWVCPKLRVLKLSRNKLKHLHYFSDPKYFIDLTLSKQVTGSFTTDKGQLLYGAHMNPERRKELQQTEKYLHDLAAFYFTAFAAQEKPVNNDVYLDMIGIHLDRDIFYSHTEASINLRQPKTCNNLQLLLLSTEEDDEEIKSISKLEMLDLSLNRFNELPWDLPCVAPHISKLNIQGNSLTDLDIVHSMPHGVKSLILDRNQLNSLDRHRSVSLPCGDPLRLLMLPEENFGSQFCRHCQHKALNSLTNLSLDHNQLSTLPVVDVVTDSSHDLELDVVYDIGTVDYLVYYPSLSILSLEHNHFKAVPVHLHRLTHLSSLSLSHNDIHVLPMEMGQINPQQLLLLKLEGLFLKNIPDHLLNRPTPKHMLMYLKAMLQKSRPYRRIKLMVVGEANKGKTSLLLNLTKKGRISRFKDVAMNINNVPLSTVGVELGDWEYSPNSRAPKVTFMTWDFGGQAEYYATHQCFLTKRSLYILVWDVTDGEQGLLDLRPWLENIEGRAPESPVFVLATHVDKLPPDTKKETLERLRERFRELYIDYCNSRYMYPQVHKQCFFINCFDTRIIDNLRDFIYDFVTKYKTPAPRHLMSEMDPLLEQPIPASYMVLEDIVRSLAEQCKKQDTNPIFTKQEFITAVKEHEAGYCGKLEELEQATHFLHENGILLHYEDSALLSNLYFLDPQWLCSMLAKVITVQEKNPYQKNGFMPVDDLHKILPSYVSEFVTLMQRFEVVLLLDARRMLIPSLLPTDKDGSIVVFLRSISNNLLDQRLTREDLLISGDDHIPAPQEIPHAPLCQTPYPVVARYYLLTFVPNGFFSRVIARLMSKDVMDTLHTSLVRSQLESDHLLNAPHWRCWRDGISIIWNHMEIFSITPVDYPLNGTQSTVLLSNSGCAQVLARKGVEIRVAILPDKSVATCTMFPGVNVQGLEDKGRCIATWLLHQAITVIDSVFEDWYEAFSKKKGFELTSISSGSPCSKCYRAVQTAKVKSLLTPLQRRHSTFSMSMEVINRWSMDEHTLYLFSTTYCSLAVEQGVELVCPTHGAMSVAEVAPDLVFSDFPSSKVFPEPSRVVIRGALGDGGFGTVFKATLQQGTELTNIAVKQFHSECVYMEQDPQVIAELKAWDIYQKASQEARVMLPLCHPHILGLIGLVFRPVMLLVELAPMGDLKSCIKRFKKVKVRLSRTTIQQTLIQTAEALQYLHSKHFIYRDLKPDNVLVWEYPTPDTQWTNEATVFIKLADYGISKEVTPQGIRGVEGTRPYLAPEVILHGGREAYSQLLDVYAFGMFMYYLTSFMTPFENDTRPLTALLEEGRRPELPLKLRPHSLPMFELMCWCWSELPQHRPTTEQILTVLRSDTFTTLVDSLSLTKDGDEITAASVHATFIRRTSTGSLRSTTLNVGGIDFPSTHLETLSLMTGSPGEELTTQVWYGTDKGNCGVVQFQRSGTHKEVIELPVKRKKYVLDVIVVRQNVWIATAGAGLWVYNTQTKQQVANWGEEDRQQIYTLLSVDDNNILALTHRGLYTFDPNPDDGTLYPTQTIAQPGDRELNEGIVIPSGANITTTEVWACSQTVLGFFILEPRNFSSVMVIKTPAVEGVSHKIRHMTTMVVDGRRVLFVADRDRILYWDVAERRGRTEMDRNCSEACHAIYGDNNPRRNRVTALLAGGDFLYVGTGGGVILVLIALTMKLHRLLYAHTKPARCLLLVQPNSVSPQVLRRLFSKKDPSPQTRAGTSSLRSLKRLSTKSSSSSLISTDHNPDKAVLISLGMAYRGVIGEADNHHSVFLLPGDRNTNTKLAKYPANHGHLLLWSAETTYTNTNTGELQEANEQEEEMGGLTLPNLCEEELCDELFQSGGLSVCV